MATKEQIQAALAEADKFLKNSKTQAAERDRRSAAFEAKMRKPKTPAQDAWHLRKVQWEMRVMKERAQGIRKPEHEGEFPEPYPDDDQEATPVRRTSKIDVQKALADTDAVMDRMRRASEARSRLLAEVEAEPLEAECDAAYAEMGQGLYRVEQGELRQARQVQSAMDAEDLRQREDERLERAGKPPPLHRVK